MRFLDQERVISNMRAAVSCLSDTEESPENLKETFINVMNRANQHLSE